MKYAPYSSSKIGLHKQCPRKFKYRYIDKLLAAFTHSEASTKGHIIHSLLEHHTKPLPEKIKIIKTDRDIQKSEFYNKDLVKEGILAYNKFIETNLGREIFSMSNIGNELWCALDNKLTPTEYHASNAMYRGKIDSIFVNNDIKEILLTEGIPEGYELVETTTVQKIQKTNPEIHIIDWKSGKDNSDGLYKQKPDQLLQYAAWYFNKMPVDTIVIRYVFVEHENAEVQYTLTRDNIDKYNTILVKGIIGAEQDTTWPKIEQPLCNWCEFQDHCINDI